MTTPCPPHAPARPFPEISGVSWEHPADRAALQALRGDARGGRGDPEDARPAGRRARHPAPVPGQRGPGRARRSFPSSGTSTPRSPPPSTGPTCPSCTSPRRPFFNAGAYGIDQPFIVVHSAAIELLDDDELRVLMSHELGHVISGHALYRTIAAILALISLGALPMLASLAVLPVRLAFLEWSRKSELSADRAGLLGAQDVVAAQRLDMKMAGGGRGEAFARPAQRGRVHAAGPRVRRERRGAGRGLQAAQHPGAHPSDAHGARRRAAALGRRAANTTGSSAASTSAAGPRPPTVRSRDDMTRRRQLLRGRGAGARHPGGGRRQARRRARARRLPERPEVVRLLVVGGGGREHALCWALRRENPDADLYCAPGNPGTAEPRRPTSPSRPTTSTASPTRPTCTGSTSPWSAPRCRWRAGSRTGSEPRDARCSARARRRPSSRRPRRSRRK